MNKYSAYIQEALDTKVPYTVKRAKDDNFVAAATIAGKQVEFYADGDETDTWEAAFDTRLSGGRTTFGLTAAGDELKVFAFVKEAFADFVSRYKPKDIFFTADKDGESDTRSKLYQRLLQRYATSWGYTYSAQSEGNTMRFHLKRR